MMTTIVGLSGKARVGKTTLAKNLLQLVPHSLSVSFADAIRKETAEEFNIPVEWMLDQGMKATTIEVSHPSYPGRYATIRELMQWVGMERRAKDAMYWSKKLWDRITFLKRRGVPMVVVDDIRFPGEAALWEDGIGPICRIHPYPEWVPGTGAGHISELALDDFDRWTVEYHPPFGGLSVVAADICERFVGR